MQLSVNSAKWKRFFSVPCALIDEYIKLADESAVKLLLFLLCDESDNIDKNDTCRRLGIAENAFDDAVIFWRQLGVIEGGGQETPAVSDIASPVFAEKEPASSETRVVHARYTPKDIAGMIEADPETRELFSEAEHTLGRLLKHCDHEMLLNLKDYYRFPVQSAILILEYCRDIGHTSARYIESVASDFFDNGITDFLSIDAEINRRKQYSSFENQAKKALGLETKPTKRQSQYILAWQDMGFDENMISEARERCVDSINKLSFQYIDKILKSWADKKIFRPEDISADTKPKQQDDTARSFDLDEFDSFTMTAAGK